MNTSMVNTSMVNTSVTTQRGSGEQEENGLLWTLQTFVQVWLLKQEQQHFLFGVWCHSPSHTRAWNLSTWREMNVNLVQRLSSYCLLKPRWRLCCYCSPAFKRALSFWCLVQGFLFCLWLPFDFDSFVRVFIPLLDVPPTQHHLKWKD